MGLSGFGSSATLIEDLTAFAKAAAVKNVRATYLPKPTYVARSFSSTILTATLLALVVPAVDAQTPGT